ncbi:MAG: class I SAM-dependent methyltransferase [Gemmatimonadota bacterium]
MQPTTGCIACGEKATRPLFEKAGHSYVACTGCGLGRLDPLPSGDGLEALFGDGYFTGSVTGGYDDYAGDEALHRDNARDRLALLERHGARPPGSFLDIGCAHGFLLAEARDSGWNVAGVEVAAGARAHAAKRFRLEVWSDLDPLPGEPRFDAIGLYQVLEHLARPDLALEAARAAIRSGGRLAIETWDRSSRVAQLLDHRWQQVSPPTVVWLFERRSLELLLDRHGWVIRWYGATRKRVTVRQVTRLLEAEVPHLARPLRIVLEKPRLRRLSLRYGLGDLVTAIAEPV